ncbi:MAG: hypothetical protein HYY40_13145 [Bacteroidetes bacterium]|nr:hypothetical protein [Bacteroidota bacterium]
MKRISSILFLFLAFGYAFTLKTHYCYYNETHERYHGDCLAHIKEAKKKNALADENIFPARYYCLDILKNAQVQPSEFVSVENISYVAILLPPVTIIPEPDFSFVSLLIPETRCRSATLLLFYSLRAPPFC